MSEHPIPALATTKNPNITQLHARCSLSHELKAFVQDSYAYYYLRRKKPSAALQYITSAMKTHSKRKDWAHVGKCHLHSAMILAKVSERSGFGG